MSRWRRGVIASCGWCLGFWADFGPWRFSGERWVLLFLWFCGPLQSVGAELVEAWACALVGRRACFEGGGRDVAPAGEELSFGSPKESHQRKGDPQSATPSRCEGATCVGAVAGCAVELALRWRAPLGQQRRVSSRGMGAATPMLTPQPPRRRRSQQGGGAEQPNSHTGHCCARPRLRSARRLRPREGAERCAA